MEEPTQTLTTAGASSYLGLSRSCLEKLRVYGGGPRYLKLRRLVRYRTTDLDAWLAQHLVSSTSEELPGSLRGGGK